MQRELLRCVNCHEMTDTNMMGGLTRTIRAHFCLFIYVKVSHLFGAFKRERYEGLSAVAKDALTEEESRLWKQWDSLRCEMHKFALASQHYVGSGKVAVSPFETSPPAPPPQS